MTARNPVEEQETAFWSILAILISNDFFLSINRNKSYSVCPMNATTCITPEILATSIEQAKVYLFKKTPVSQLESEIRMEERMLNNSACYSSPEAHQKQRDWIEILKLNLSEYKKLLANF